MAEALTQFVKRRQPDWTALDALIAEAGRRALGLEEIRRLDSLYRNTANDLARAQAFYASTDVEGFLHDLCGRAYTRLYQPPRRRLERLARFYRQELPSLARTEGRFLGLAAALFSLGILIGAIVVLADPRGAELLLPFEIRDHIARRELWTDSILTTMPPGVLASAIATNNLTVTILAFGSGVFLGLGPLYILVNNGIHLGSIFAACWQNDLGGSLFDFIAAHGPVELSVIVVAGAAGLMLGQALLVPGERPRGEALQARGRSAVRLVVGCAPFLATIALVEGFVSPGHLFPTVAKAAFGVCSGALFWGYLLLAGKAPSFSEDDADSSSEARRSR
jgi:uncharacterized membrane protein SpoIIM required for sporulation